MPQDTGSLGTRPDRSLSRLPLDDVVRHGAQRLLVGYLGDGCSSDGYRELCERWMKWIALWAICLVSSDTFEADITLHLDDAALDHVMEKALKVYPNCRGGEGSSLMTCLADSFLNSISWHHHIDEFGATLTVHYDRKESS